ncbi:hypothetical protein C1646_756579 [Rhizophagus diaphanus]|nr:hypothetical protein C1646_756579 [Rhizophagus diaphanus] [Rhizophagus sp. MUCL 43196]
MSKVCKLFTKTESVKKVVLNNRQKITLMDIMNEVKLVSTVLLHDIISNNIAEYLRDLITINDLLIVQYKADLIQYKNTQIKDFVQNRCDNLMNDKKKMINSFMNQEIKSIVIDRIIVTENDEEILKTAPECIKKEVNAHFQNIAEPYHTRGGELSYIYSSILNGKASGPSKILYEMIKHSSVKIKLFITNYLNECLTLRKIPKEWKLADLYPIPKPKP